MKQGSQRNVSVFDTTSVTDVLHLHTCWTLEHSCVLSCYYDAFHEIAVVTASQALYDTAQRECQHEDDEGCQPGKQPIQ